MGWDGVQAVATADDGPAIVGVGREVLVEGVAEVEVVVTGDVDVVVTAAVVDVVDASGRVVAVVTVGDSLPRLCTDRADSSGDRGHATTAPRPRVASTISEVSRRRRRADSDGESSNTTSTWPLGRARPAELRKESEPSNRRRVQLPRRQDRAGLETK